MAFGTDPTPDGLANPPIDDLMKHADSKYALAIFAAKRARQINSYFTQLNEGLLDTMVRGEGPSSALLPMAVLLGFALVFGLIAARLFRWED